MDRHAGEIRGLLNLLAILTFLTHVTHVALAQNKIAPRNTAAGYSAKTEIPLIPKATVAAPTPNEILIFSATADIPYSESAEAVLTEQIAEHNLYSPSEFMVHLGDIKGSDDDCSEDYYRRFAEIMSASEVPVFVMVGDNEWTDCRQPANAWSYWEKYILAFEENFCGAPAVERQDVRPENIAWVQKGVLLIGLNMVGGDYKPRFWDERLQDCAAWVTKQLQEKKSLVRTAIVFAHALKRGQDDPFKEAFLDAAVDFERPVLYLQADSHTWSVEDPFEVPNVIKVTVDQGDKALPLQVTVGLDNRNTRIFSFDRTPWNSNSEPVSRAPCISGPQIAVVPSSLDFGPTDVGDSRSQTITVENAGNETLEISEISFDGPDHRQFRVDAGGEPISLPAGENHEVLVSFEPSSGGAKSASLRLFSNDLNGTPSRVNLQGVGIEPEPEIAADPAGYDFGLVAIGDTVSSSIVVINEGMGELTLTAISLADEFSGQFKIDAGGNAVALQAGSRHEIKVSFAPLTAEPKTTFIRVENNDHDKNPFDITLTGTGDLATSVQTPNSHTKANESEATHDFRLRGIYPNPLNLQATIEYTVPEETRVRATVYNIAGQRIRTLLDEIEPSGDNVVIWDGRNDHDSQVGSGIYLIYLEAGTRRLVGRLILQK